MSPERVCVLEKSPAGYGFHLHSEKGRPGQFVRLVEAGSAAERAGLRAGDRLIRVCGEDVRELGHQQVVGKIRAAEGRLTLEVQGPEAEEGPRAGEEEAGVPEKELRPRLCSMKKGPSGYGFNLHSDKSHPGQYVRAVDPDSPAERAGLLPKDRIIEVNGVCMEGMQHADMVSTIKSGGDETSLLVVDPETDSFFQECDVTPGRQHLTGPLPKRVANGDLEKVSKPDEGLESEGLQESPLSSPEPVTPRLDERQEMPESPPVPVSATMLAADPLLDLNMSLALAKERAHQKRSQKKAPAMDWSKKNQVFSSL